MDLGAEGLNPMTGVLIRDRRGETQTHREARQPQRQRLEPRGAWSPRLWKRQEGPSPGFRRPEQGWGVCSSAVLSRLMCSVLLQPPQVTNMRTLLGTGPQVDWPCALYQEAHLA